MLVEWHTNKRSDTENLDRRTPSNTLFLETGSCSRFGHPSSRPHVIHTVRCAYTNLTRQHKTLERLSRTTPRSPWRPRMAVAEIAFVVLRINVLLLALASAYHIRLWAVQRPRRMGAAVRSLDNGVPPGKFQESACPQCCRNFGRVIHEFARLSVCCAAPKPVIQEPKGCGFATS